MPAILIIIGTILIYFSTKSIKKDDKNNFEKILLKKEENIELKDIEITKLKMQFSESILELQKEIYDIKEKMNKKEEKNTELKIKTFDNNNKVENLRIENSKATQIQELENKGLTDEEICNELKIGRGELLLIKGLYNGLRA